MIEEWRPIEGFEAQYEVSNLGGVRSLSRKVRTCGGTRLHRGRIMTPSANRDGYTKVVLRVDGVHTTKRIHRLVCETFNGPAPENCEVDHIDGDRTNACASNLRWLTRAQNLERRNSGRPSVGAANGFAKLSEKGAAEILARKGENACALGAEFGVTNAAVYDIWLGRRWKHLSAPGREAKKNAQKCG